MVENPKTKKAFAITFFLSLSSLVFVAAYLLSKKSYSSTTSYFFDAHVTQYSDRNITENAIIKDQRFERIAFAPSGRDANAVVPDQFATVFRAFKSLFSNQDKDVLEHGTWVWTPIMQMTEGYMSEIISGAKKEGVNVIYLSIDSYLDVYAMPIGNERDTKKEEFKNILTKFIKLAKESGIEVDAEAGWRNWSEDGHGYKPFAIVSFVKNFNIGSPYKFRGFQYDVEPYLLAEYKVSNEGKARVLTRFLELVDDTSHYLRDTDLKLSVVIPDFYDKRDKMTPKFEYKSKKDFVFSHLLNILEDRSGSSVIIMSYRNFAQGRDGSIEVSKNELYTAHRGRFNTEIIIAQETGNVPPPFITFYGTSKEYLEEETAKLAAAFTSHPNFAGLAIHYANAYLELK